MIVVTELGKGRMFHNAMGHDPKPMAGVAFQTLDAAGHRMGGDRKGDDPNSSQLARTGDPASRSAGER